MQTLTLSDLTGAHLPVDNYQSPELRATLSWLTDPLYVSGGRICRHLNAPQRNLGHTADSDGYHGALYVCGDDWPNNDRIARRHPDSVTFEARAYEHTMPNPDFRAWGETTLLAIPRQTEPDILGPGYERNDFQLWNIAAAMLHRLSSELTSCYSWGSGPVHYESGRWRVRYLGRSGVDSAWPIMRTLSAGLLSLRTISCLHHFAAKFTSATGAETLLRIRPEWSEWRNGYQELTLRTMTLRGEPRPLPKAVERWILGRFGWPY